MKTTITINGKPVEIELTESQVALIKKASEKITDRIKTFTDVLEDQHITAKEWSVIIKGLTPDEIAYKQVKLIALSLNEGVLMNPTDEDQYKYYPYFEVNGDVFSYDGYDYWFSGTIVPSRLCFKSSELAIYAGKEFIDIYNNLLK